MNIKKLDELKKEVENCTKCELYKSRNNVVFGDGNPRSKIFVVGEAPGYYEDKTGKPFVGRSGKLLDKIFAACGFKREEHIYIGNIIKCRPPDNRMPTCEERENCFPYLLKQIEIINPKIIILLGSTALKQFTDSNARITKMRGQWIKWNNYLAMPTYHPSALLRNPLLKRDAWEDFKKIVYKYREIVDTNHFSENV